MENSHRQKDETLGLKDAAGISFNVLAKMGKNEFVSMESLYKICVTLDCGINEIMEFTINNKEDKCEYE